MEDYSTALQCFNELSLEKNNIAMAELGFMLYQKANDYQNAIIYFKECSLLPINKDFYLTGIAFLKSHINPIEYANYCKLFFEKFLHQLNISDVSFINEYVIELSETSSNQEVNTLCNMACELIQKEIPSNIDKKQAAIAFENRASCTTRTLQEKLNDYEYSLSFLEKNSCILGLANIYFELKNYDMALLNYDKAKNLLNLAEWPSKSIDYFTEILFLKKRFEEIISFYTANPYSLMGEKSFFLYGESLSKTGKKQEAIDLHLQALTLYPHCQKNKAAIAKLNFELGNIPTASELYKSIIQQAQANEKKETTVADHYYQYAKIQTILLKNPTLTNTNDASCVISWNDIIVNYKNAVDIDPANYNYAIGYLNALREGKQHQKFIDFSFNIIKCFTTIDFQLQQQLALAHFARKQYNDACKQFTQCITLLESDPTLDTKHKVYIEILLKQASCLTHLNKNTEVEKLYQKILTINPNELSALNKLAKLYYNTDRTNFSIHFYNRLITAIQLQHGSLRSKDSPIYAMLYNIYFKENRHLDCVKILVAHFNLDGDFNHLKKTCLHFNYLRDYNIIYDIGKKLCQNPLHNLHGLYAQSLYFFDKQDYLTAEPIFEKIINQPALSSHKKMIHYNYGVCAYHLNKFELALTHFIIAKDMKHDNDYLHYYLGVCHYKLNKYAEAILLLEPVSHDNLLFLPQLDDIYSSQANFRGNLYTSPARPSPIMDSISV